jgi:hypothetical protein
MNTIYDLLNELYIIVKNIDDLKMKICSRHNLKYTCQDARLVALDSMNSDILATSILINSYIDVFNSCCNNNKLDLEKFCSKIHCNKDYETIEDVTFNFLNISLMTNVLFRIDNLLSNLLVAIEGKTLKIFIQK